MRNKPKMGGKIMPKVSVIVPVYNVEQYLAKCLDSLVGQTLEEIEIIVVNDGTKDHSQEIIDKYQKGYPNKIKSLIKTNGGLSDARNFGLPHATGEYIAFLDSDDYVDLAMYETMYNKAKEENADMVECDFYWVYPNKTKEDIGSIYHNKKEMLVQARVVAWNKLIKREILEKAEIEFPKGYRYEDVEFFYKLLPFIEKVAFVKKPFIYYIQRENSISNSQNERTKEIIDILEHVLIYYKEMGLYEEYKVELEYIYTRYLLCSSFLRMVKIRNKKTRKELLKLAWESLNKTFPNWKKNEILRKEKSAKNKYMKTVNHLTFPIYAFLFQFKG